MNEKVLAEQLEQDIDRLLDGRALADRTELGQEYNQALETARLLAHQDMSHESRIRKSLKQGLQTRIYAHRKEWSLQGKGNYAMKPHTKLFVRLGMIAAVFAALIALPPVRALAQDIIKQIGPLVIVSQPEAPWEAAPADFNPTPVPGADEAIPERAVSTTEQGPSNGPTPVPTDANLRSITPEEASSQLDFRVLQPAYIPNGYALSVPPNFVHVQAGQISSSMVYTTANDAYLGIAQSTFDTQEKSPFSIGDATVMELTVRGQPAIFIEDAMMMTVQDANGQNINIPVDYLLWEENGQFFVINATELTQEEMLKVAKSLK